MILWRPWWFRFDFNPRRITGSGGEVNVARFDRYIVAFVQYVSFADANRH